MSRLAVVLFTTLSVAVASSLYDVSQCGQTKACFPPSCDPLSDGACKLAVSYRPFTENAGSSYWLEIELAGNVADNQYVAVAFSHNEKMHNSSVIECSRLPNEVEWSGKASWNDGRPVNVRIEGEAQLRPSIMRTLKTSNDEGRVYCKIQTRVSSLPTNDPRFFTPSLDQQYYVLMAMGPTKDTGLGRHPYGGIAVSPAAMDIMQPRLSGHAPSGPAPAAPPAPPTMEREAVKESGSLLSLVPAMASLLLAIV